MITLGKLVELIQGELGQSAGSDDGADKFSYEIVKENIGLAFMEIVRQTEMQETSGPNSILGAVSTPYEVDVIELDGKSIAQLNPAPITGTSAIASIVGKDTGIVYGIRVNAAQNTIMQILTSNDYAGAYVNNSNTLMFSGLIQDTTVIVDYVPNIADLDDESNIVLEGYEIMIKDLVIARLAPRINYRQDSTNDSKEDIEKARS